MKRIAFWILIELLALVGASAQSLSPIIGEGGKGKLKGSFQIGNTEVIPMVTTVDVRSATFAKDGSVTYRALDEDVTVQLKETSAKIGPRQSHVFYYSVECRNPHACVVIFLPSSTFGRAANGMQVRVVLPHSVYLCSDSARGCRARVRSEAGIAQGR